jgi:hypothetical protein
MQYVGSALLRALLQHENQCAVSSEQGDDEVVGTNSIKSQKVTLSRSPSPGSSKTETAQLANGRSSKQFRGNKEEPLLKTATSGKRLSARTSDGRKTSAQSGSLGDVSTISSPSVRTSNSAGRDAVESSDETAFPAPGSVKTRSGTARSGLPLPLRRSQSSFSGSSRGLDGVSNIGGGRAVRCVDEICKGGYLRCVAWLLLHNQFVVRALAADVSILQDTRPRWYRVNVVIILFLGAADYAGSGRRVAKRSGCRHVGRLCRAGAGVSSGVH